MMRTMALCRGILPYTKERRRARSASSLLGCPYCVHLGPANAALLQNRDQNNPVAKSPTHIQETKYPNGAKLTATLGAFSRIPYCRCRLRAPILRAIHVVYAALLARVSNGRRAQFLLGQPPGQAGLTYGVLATRDAFYAGRRPFRQSWRISRGGRRPRWRSVLRRFGSEKF